MKKRGFKDRRKLILLGMVAVVVACVVLPAIAQATVGFGTSNTATNSHSTITLSKPASTAAGDLLLVTIGRMNGSNGSATAPAGWTQVSDANSGTAVGQTIFYRVAGASEPASYNFSLSWGGRNHTASGVIARYTGVDTSVNPIAAVSANSGSGTTLTAPSVDGYDGSMIVACYTVGNEQNMDNPTTPAGMTSRARAAQANGPTVRFADQSISTTGATGDKVSTGNPTGAWVATLVSLTCKVPLTVSATGVDKVYDGTTDATVDLSGTGIALGDDVTLNYASASFADKNVNAGIQVDVSDISISGPDAYKYALQNTTTTTSASITPAPLTVDATGIDKAYDGTTDAEVTLDSGDVLEDDTVTLDYDSATFADEDVGDDIDVAVEDISISGDDASNYDLQNTEAATTASITPAELTVDGAAAQDKAYDGTTDAEVDFSEVVPVGVIDDEEVSIDASDGTAAFADKNANDDIAVTVDGLALTGADTGNYSLTQPVLSASITPAELTVEGAVAQDKIYEGTTDALVDYSGADLVGIFGVDDVSIDDSVATATFAAKNVDDDIAVAVDGLALVGADADNYTVTAPDDLTADITAAELTVDGAVAQDKVYDGTIDAVVDYSGASLSGVADGDDVTVDATDATATFADKNANGDIIVTVDGLALAGADMGNYTLTQPVLSANIDAAPLAVDATGVDKAYDGTTDAEVDLSSDDVVEDDDVTFDYASAAFADKNVADDIDIAVTGISIDGDDGGNYELQNTEAATTASITPAELTLDGAVAEDKVYDGTTEAVVDYSGASLVGVIGDDEVTLDGIGATAAFADKNVGDDIAVTDDGLALAGADAGNYTVTTPDSLTADITPAELTVDATGIDKAYDATTDATVNLSSADIAPGDDVTLSYTSATFADEDVGDDIDVAVAGISLGGDDASNYELQNTEAATSADITPADLTITARNQTKIYKKTFTFSGTEFTVSGLIDGTVTSATLASNGAASTAAPGTYPIVPSAALGSGLSNYEITYANGAMTVTGGWRVAPFRKPLRASDARRFHRGTIIPVAFKVRDYYGHVIKTAKPRLRLYSKGTKVRGPVTVRYNSVKHLYIYKLKTATLKLASYNVRISLGTGNTGRSVSFRIIP